MLDLDAAGEGLCVAGRCGACDRARAAVAALRAVLETTPEELGEHMYIKGGLHGTEEWRRQNWRHSSTLAEENIIYARAALACLKRKAGVTP